MKKAFTMIELIFVIAVIGILSAIAIPKFAVTRDDAVVTKARVAVASLRSALAIERQKNILRGSFNDVNGSTLEGLMEYGLGSKWVTSGTNDNTFTFTGPNSQTCIFTVTGNKFVKGTCSVVGMQDL